VLVDTDSQFRRFIIGTFAILHQHVGMPTSQEIEAIDLITEHVADAIMWFRNPGDLGQTKSHSTKAPSLKLVSNNQESLDPIDRLFALIAKLQSKAADLDNRADYLDSDPAAQELRSAAELSRKLAANLLSQIELIESGKPFP